MSGLNRVRPLEIDQQQWERRAKAMRLITHLRALLRYTDARTFIAELLCELVSDVERALRSAGQRPVEPSAAETLARALEIARAAEKAQLNGVGGSH